MGLKNKEFSILTCLLREGRMLSQRSIADRTGLSVGTVNSTMAECRDRGYLDSAGITETGVEALQPYRVTNAVIMAAGLSSRFAPISYERPKGMLQVKGEVLVERQIGQLREAGIDEIILVLGYMKEEFFYLADKYGVDIVINPDYAVKNNYATLYLVRHRLDNTFICSSDDYFTENPFEPYVYQSYYAGEYSQCHTDEYGMKTGPRDVITSVLTDGGSDLWFMTGHAYFDRGFSRAFAALLEKVYVLPETTTKLWEKVYGEHIGELPPMVLRKYEKGIIHEFDSLDELNEFDPEFIDNVDSSILDNIAAVLGCGRHDVRNIVPIKQGLTNLSFRFDVGEEAFVYRHPGFGTNEIISRQSETFSQGVARDLGIDHTFIHENPEEGWKISRFIEVTESFDYHDEEHVAGAMEIARRLHGSGEEGEWFFDVHQDTLKQVKLLDEHARTSFPDFQNLLERMNRLDALLKAESGKPCLCHNDFYDANLLIHGDEMELIDWEYSGMSDYASDLGVFICCCDSYTHDDVMHVLETYFQRELTDVEYRHCMGFISLVAFHWFVWALYRDVCGTPVGPLLYTYYRYTKDYARIAFPLFGEEF